MNFINKPALYTSLVIGAVGTFFILLMERSELVIGWWAGVIVGILNFAFLISGLRKSQEQTGKAKVPRQPFFIRYIGLAFVFFLILQMGQEQFGAALLGFGSYYMAMLVHYLIRMRKGNAGK